MCRVNIFLMASILLVIILFNGCSLPNRVNVIKNDDVLSDQKTIFTPAGTGGLLGVVKQILSDNKWKIVVLKGPARTTGSLDEAKIDISQYGEATARYILYINSKYLGTQHCNPNFNGFAGVPLTSGYIYSISIVDWKTGNEIMAIGGSGCLYDILHNLKANVP